MQRDRYARMHARAPVKYYMGADDPSNRARMFGQYFLAVRAGNWVHGEVVLALVG